MCLCTLLACVLVIDLLWIRCPYCRAFLVTRDTLRVLTFSTDSIRVTTFLFVKRTLGRAASTRAVTVVPL